MKITLKKQIIITSIAIGLIPALVLGVIAKIQSGSALIRQAEHQLFLFSDNNEASIEAYFTNIKNQLETFAEMEGTEDALVAFTAAVEKLPYETNAKLDDAALRSRYQYQVDNTAGTPTNSLQRWLNLDSTGKLMQHLFISGNTNPIGEKQNLVDPEDGSSYSAVHAQYHEGFKHFQEVFGYYDLFLVDAKTGRIVYSVFKEVDYATSMFDGPYASSGIGRAAQAAIRNGKTTLTNFEQYEPSYSGQASFIATPVNVDGEIVGAVIFQMPVDEINKLVSLGLSEQSSQESYLVGAEGHFKTDTFHSKENLLGAKMEGNLISQAQEHMNASKDEHGIITGTSYTGETVKAAFHRLDIEGLDWFLFAQVDLREINAPARALQLVMFVALLIIAVVSILISLWQVSSIMKPVQSLVAQLKSVITQVDRSVKEIETVTDSMVAASEETSQQSILVKQNSTRASENATSVAAAVEEMDSSIASINSNIQVTDECIDEAVEKSQKTGVIVGKLDEATGNISNILSLIGDIADQTNLLALNAAIEAARAGDAGRGFAVVAEEVKKLADSTIKATSEIQSQMDAIKASSNESVSAIHSIGDTIQQVKTNAAAVRKAVEEQSAATSEISSRINDTVGQVGELDQNMQGIEEASRDTATASNQVRQATDEMREGMQKLNDEAQVTLTKMGLA